MATTYRNERGEWVPLISAGKKPKLFPFKKGGGTDNINGSGRQVAIGEYSRPIENALSAEELATLAKEFSARRKNKNAEGHS